MAPAMSACTATKLISYLRGRLTNRSFLLTNSTSCLTERNFASSGTSTISKNSRKKKKEKVKDISTKQLKLQVKAAAKYSPALVKEKRRTRSDKEFDEDAIRRYVGAGRGGDGASHIPVMLAEVLDVFSSPCWRPLHSFVDCTLGAAGHSSAIIQAHPELKLYVGMDVDPVAHAKAQATLDAIFGGHNCNPNSDFKAHTVLKNFGFIKSVLSDINSEPSALGVDGILMDLGMSSMQVDDPKRGFSVLGKGPLDMRMDPQATLKAEDILNSWPDAEVERILREYGEESNWRLLQKKIAKARLNGGLHSTCDLVNLIQNSTPKMRGGRQGWIKTATRVFQALRIAVNDELNRLEDSLHNCFDCLAPGGRLAVISFHSLEDRIVKQTFLKIFNDEDGDVNEGERERFDHEEDAWIKQTIHGSRGTILTKRPITPSEEEERLNRRSRSAKLRVIQKGWSS